MTIDIHSKGEYPANELSNFAQHKFTLDGVLCNSMEGFLQSLKYKNIRKQEYICSLIGIEAKKAGKKKRIWKLTHKVYWRGKKYDLFDDDLQILIDRAYDEMFKQNDEFKNAVFETGTYDLEHTIGITNQRKTILTRYNFLRRIKRLRALAKL